MKRSAWRYLWTSIDIRKKLLITLALLILYRLAANYTRAGDQPGCYFEHIPAAKSCQQPVRRV